MKARIAPSILSADFSKLQAELATIDRSDMIHVDVMDGHFVPNMTFGLPVVKRIHEVTPTPLDVHLMIENPDRWVRDYAEYAESVTFHYEATMNPESVIADLQNSRAKVAMAIKPATSVGSIKHLLPQLDMLLVMTVEPGFGGQSLIPETIEKVRAAKKLKLEQGLSLSIQVDGGITSENIKIVAAAGADTFVAGTAVFGASDRNQAIDKLRHLADSA